MDPALPRFGPRSEADVIDLVARYPLAWLIAFDRSPLLLPVRPIVERGRLTGLHGHIPRRYCGRFEDRDALVLFTGPSAYISPSWLTNRKQAPTWASASAAFRCQVRLLDEPQQLRRSLAELVDAMEDGRTNHWILDELDERYALLARRIVAFHADILDRRAVFRLGQDEDETSFLEILSGLRLDGKGEFAELMESFRPRDPAKAQNH